MTDSTQPATAGSTGSGGGLTHVRTVAIAVDDQDRALAFYSDVLGLEVRLDAEFAPGNRWIEVAPAGAETSVALVPATREQPAGGDTGIRFTTADAAADHARFAAAGVDVDDVLRWEGVPPMFQFRDVDGNLLTAVEA
ncbi:Glyoxalase/bleomycin resistance protein/dioxygenase [Beutenbergia cavernae DSM 12333]|uniref:Glyoxalase/bleomycin resistance protein/dioxygenase n=1 Tax=Beutenbergia cavernae (strain ATCC BAA-8 / DSM 12333 / CCUG 43141 / JCM 11478 / NBRC 16432 / NCIMB 13614 / HKI 0122) TaxID=471853 RepID=C5C3T3_BEUC1|nr:VOC family protein [Beutenbergia cavernae]ACQ81992.1 Glyoxalase/bleomycin resistance protein/dioxygenase [Beutenbergia cavernae DSM 12333]